MIFSPLVRVPKENIKEAGHGTLPNILLERFELKESEREAIREAMREHKVHSAPATARPPYIPEVPVRSGWVSHGAL